MGGPPFGFATSIFQTFSNMVKIIRKAQLVVTDENSDHHGTDSPPPSMVSSSWYPAETNTTPLSAFFTQKGSAPPVTCRASACMSVHPVGRAIVNTSPLHRGNEAFAARTRSRFSDKDIVIMSLRTSESSSWVIGRKTLARSDRVKSHRFR